MRRHPLYGLLAEFNNPEDLLAAARRAREEGYTRLDAFTPFPVEDLAEYGGRGRNGAEQSDQKGDQSMPKHAEK